MEYRKILVSLVALFAIAAVFAASASATDLGSFSRIEVNGVEADNNAVDIADFSGNTVPVRINFESGDYHQDVRVKAWISGDKELSVSSERFDVIAGKVYSRLLAVPLPTNLDELNESYQLKILVESRDGSELEDTIQLTVQRESYKVEILDVSMDSQISSGANLAIDIVIKNRGRQFADDTFVKATIPALGVERTVYFGDLAPIDQGEDDTSRGSEEDAASGRLNLKIPSSAPAGVYLVQVEAYNSDSATTTSKKVAIVGASQDSLVVSNVNSKTIAVGEKGTYSLTLVNSGDNVRLYQLVFQTASGLTVSADETVVAVPAGSSKTISLTASAAKAGKYGFAVDVNSNGELVKKESYLADVQGNSFSGNATIILTVVLAIVFVVLLVVLIVLLTRKPQKTEEFGESYY